MLSHCSAQVCSPLRPETDLGVSVTCTPALCPDGLLSSSRPRFLPQIAFFSAGESRVAILTLPRPLWEPCPCMQELIRGAVIQLGSEDLCLFPVPSCVYPRKHFCLVGSESPRSGSPSPACCEQEGEREERGRGAWQGIHRQGNLPPALGTVAALQCNTWVLGCRGRKVKWRWSIWLLLYRLAGHPSVCPRGAESSRCLPSSNCMGCGLSPAWWLVHC